VWINSWVFRADSGLDRNNEAAMVRPISDLDIRFERAGRGYKSVVVASPAGEGHEAGFRRPFSAIELQNFGLRMQRGSGTRRIETPLAAEAKLRGAKLFRALFHDELLTCLQQSVAAAYVDDGVLRIRLRLGAAPELANLPWEYLYDRQRNRFLCLWDRTPVVRYSEMGEPLRPLQVNGPLRMLVMVSSPSDYAALDVDDEWAKLNGALADLIRDERVILERLPEPTWASLRRGLRRHDYHIFHFIGHGGFDRNHQEGVLVFTANDGTGQWVSGERLGIDLGNASSIRLAVLNACEGARSDAVDPFSGVAQSLVQQGVPAVVAMQYEISDAAAIAFTSGFYGAVADGLSIEASMSQARRDIHDISDLEWATPVLYLRCAGSQLFAIDTPTVGPESTAPKEGGAVSVAPPAPAAAFPPDMESMETDALVAFYTEDWDKAVDLFEQIVARRSDFPSATDRLASARRQLVLSSRYAQADVALDASEWEAAVEHLGAIVAMEPTYRDAIVRLEQARQELEIARLRDEAKRLSSAGQWKAVLKIRERFSSLAPGEDPDGIFASAEQAVAQRERASRLSKSYAEAVRAIASSKWTEAHEGLMAILALDSGYRDTAKLLAVVLSHLPPEEGSAPIPPPLQRPVLEELDSASWARVWDAATGMELQHLRHNNEVHSVSFSPDGQTLVTGSRDEGALIWDAATGRKLLRLGPANWVYSVAFSPDGQRVAAAAGDDTARIWDAHSGSELVRFSHSDVVQVTFSPDGARLVTVGGGDTACVWDAADGRRPLLRLSQEGAVIQCAAFSPDGRRLATAGPPDTVVVWDVSSGRELLSLILEDAVALAFSPDGHKLATAGLDSVARILDAESGSELLQLSHEGAVFSVAFSPDSRALATGSCGKGGARIWDVASGNELLRLQPDKAVFSVAFSPDGRKVATGEWGCWEPKPRPSQPPLVTPWIVDPVVRAAKLSKFGLYREALVDLDQALKLNPNDAVALKWRGNALFGRGKYREALIDLTRSDQVNRHDPLTLRVRGATLSILGRSSEALVDLNRSLELEPDNAFALRWRGVTFSSVGRHRDALPDLNRSLELEHYGQWAAFTRTWRDKARSGMAERK
jgi:tetratricopeptide (TPR) repeat protein